MHKTIFRREIDSFNKPDKKVTSNNIVIRKRRNMTPVINYFSKAEKLKLVKSLFNHDNKKFILFMEELDRKSNWRDAYTFIESELTKHKVDIFSSKARFLTDRIYHIFFPEDFSIS